MAKYIVMALALVLLQGCAAKIDKGIKSPCVAAEVNADAAAPAQHPCTRRPANSNWLG